MRDINNQLYLQSVSRGHINCHNLNIGSRQVQISNLEKYHETYPFHLQ